MEGIFSTYERSSEGGVLKMALEMPLNPGLLIVVPAIFRVNMESSIKAFGKTLHYTCNLLSNRHCGGLCEVLQGASISVIERGHAEDVQQEHLKNI